MIHLILTQNYNSTMEFNLIDIIILSCFGIQIVVSIMEILFTWVRNKLSENQDTSKTSTPKYPIHSLLWLQIRLTIVIVIFVLLAMRVVDYMNSIDVVNTVYKESNIHIDSESVFCEQQHFHLPIETMMEIILWLGALVVLIIITLQIIKYILFFVEVILVESKILIATRTNTNNRDIMNDIETLTNKLRYRNLVNMNFRSLWNIYD